MTDLSDLFYNAFWRVSPPDVDPAETAEWMDAFDALVKAEGPERATFLLDADGTVLRAWRKVKVPNHAAEVLKAAQGS